MITTSDRILNRISAIQGESLRLSNKAARKWEEKDYSGCKEVYRRIETNRLKVMGWQRAAYRYRCTGSVVRQTPYEKVSAHGHIWFSSPEILSLQNDCCPDISRFLDIDMIRLMARETELATFVPPKNQPNFSAWEVYYGQLEGIYADFLVSSEVAAFHKRNNLAHPYL